MIQEAMAKGEFDNLSNAGKPLKERPVNPYVDTVTHRINEVCVCVCVCVCVRVCMCMYLPSCSVLGLSYTRVVCLRIYCCPVFPSVVHSLPL